MNAPSPASAVQGDPSTTRLSIARDFARLAVKGGALAVAALTTLFSVAWFVPDGNDYSLASNLKHQRLAQLGAPKIVLVGGSNLAFGIDSTMIERATGCPVVNMGMNGYLGVRYMLAEIKADVKPSDIVVLAFEYDNFFKSVDGTPIDLMGVVKGNPSAFSYLSLTQQAKALSTLPTIAQQKTMRLLNKSVIAVKNALTGGHATRSAWIEEMESIESLAGFTREGDLISHLKVKWPFPPEPGIVPQGGRIDPTMVTLMRDFTAEMTKRDVSVIVSYTPVLREFYDSHRNELDEAHKRIVATPPLNAPSPPSAFVYDGPFFFDTVYHLNAEGRPLRTQKLIDDLTSQLHERARCPQSAAAFTGE